MNGQSGPTGEEAFRMLNTPQEVFAERQRQQAREMRSERFTIRVNAEGDLVDFLFDEDGCLSTDSVRHQHRADDPLMKYLHIAHCDVFVCEECSLRVAVMLERDRGGHVSWDARGLSVDDVFSAFKDFNTKQIIIKPLPLERKPR